MHTSLFNVGSLAGDLPDDLREKVTLTAVSAVFDGSLSIGSWSTAVARLSSLESSVPWWIGDALVFGESSYGNKYADAVEATGRSLKTLKNYAWVSRAVPVENRDPALPWRLYREVARLDAAEQRVWLDRARSEGWIADDLRRELTAAQHRAQDTPTFEPTPEHEQGRLDRLAAAEVECPNCSHRFTP